MTEETLIKVKRYLEQQEEQFGDLTFFEKPKRKQQARKKTNEPDSVHLKEQEESSSINETLDVAADLYSEQTAWKNCSSLKEMHSLICNCLNCELGKTRKNFVFGVGNPNADIMIIGEAPGADEDEQGEPFVGKAGQLLTKILEAINIKRSEVFIANIIKCRPPDNRKPLVSETEQCMPYLLKQISLIKPAFIVALGLTAIDTLLNAKHKMGDMRGKLIDYCGAKMLVTYHPAALLRNPEWKKFVWEDVKLLRKLYDEFLQNKEI